MAQPAIKADEDEPDPSSVKMMEMVDRLPPEFRALVHEYGYEMVSRHLPYEMVKGLCITVNENGQRAPHNGYGRHHHTRGVNIERLSRELAKDRERHETPEYREDWIELQKRLVLYETMTQEEREAENVRRYEEWKQEQARRKQEKKERREQFDRMFEQEERPRMEGRLKVAEWCFLNFKFFEPTVRERNLHAERFGDQSISIGLIGLRNFIRSDGYANAEGRRWLASLHRRIAKHCPSPFTREQLIEWELIQMPEEKLSLTITVEPPPPDKPPFKRRF